MKIKRTLWIAVLSLMVMPPAWGQGTLFVESDKVGVGVANPLARLHVESSTTNGDVVLVRSSDDGSLLRLFETSNTGGLLSLFDSAGNEDFRISATGHSWFSSAGNVGIDCNDPDHDLTIGGAGAGCNVGTFSEIDAGESQFTVSSSRTIKENFRLLEVSDILDKLSSIPVYSYDFVDGPEDRIGLMAEDFHQVFGRGSDKMLSGHEVQMALWLAVQSLAQDNQKLEAENLELAQRIERLEQASAAE